MDRAHFELGLLYYQHAEYELASEHLFITAAAQAGKYRALALYKNNDLSEAKDAFKRINSPDDQTLYYYGQTCEKLNLFDEAIDLYEKVSQGSFQGLARERIQAITRSEGGTHLESLPAELQEMEGVRKL